MDRKIANCHIFQHSRKNAKQLKYQRAITFHNTIIQWNSIIESQNLPANYNKIIKPVRGFIISYHGVSVDSPPILLELCLDRVSLP